MEYERDPRIVIHCSAIIYINAPRDINFRGALSPGVCDS
jgi:hypothetical protein